MSILAKNSVLFIVIICSIINAQTTATEDSVINASGSPAKPETATRQASPASYLQKDITTSRMLGAIGCITHFTGSIMIFTSSITGDAVLNWVGAGLDILGPIASCIGATLVEDAMEEDYPAFPRHKFWSYYATGGVLCAANVGTSIVQFAVLTHNEEYKFNASPIIFLVLKIVTYGAAEAYLGRAAVGPLLYARKAERTFQKTHAIHFKMVPTFTLDGGKGLCVLGTF